jgi:hypothetical protein
MRKIILLNIALILVNFLTNCSNGNTDKTKTTVNKIEDLPSKFIGSYVGVQESYNLLNKNGEEMVINGEFVSVPSSIYKFIIRNKGEVILLQITKEGKLTTTSEYYGDYEIISQDENQAKIKCSFNSGDVSNPEYILTLNDAIKKYLCNSSNEPELILDKK